MRIRPRILCRLCLKECVDFKAVEDYMKDVLDVLLLKMNLAVSEEPVMCTNCAVLLIECFNFKAACFYTHDYFVPFLDDRKVSKLDLRDVYKSKHKNAVIPEDHSVCACCMALAKKCKAVSLDNKKGDVMLDKSIEKYLPELDFSTIEEPMICLSCCGSLKTCFRFVTSCLFVEEEITEYRRLTGADVIEIADVLQLTFRDVSRVEEDGNTIDIVSTEEKFSGDLGNADKQVGHEIDMEEQKLLPNEDVEIKTDQHDFDKFQGTFTENKNPNDPSRMSVVVSEMREPEDHIKQLSTPRKTFPCEICSYVTKHKYRLAAHLLTHKSPSEIKMFKCETCPFEAKRKQYIKQHLLTHKSFSEIKMFKCEMCLYGAKRKHEIKRHLLTHKDPSEIKMFKCEMCSYETKYKHGLKMHLLTHKSPFEVKMFNCEMCSYETKYKRSLEAHLLIHKSPSEIKMFKCALCSYQGKRKGILRQHLLIHKSRSEIMFKCELCTYKAKQESDLKNHLLTHKSPSQIKMFKCETCPFETKRKQYLKQHLLTHKSISEVKMFK